MLGKTTRTPSKLSQAYRLGQKNGKAKLASQLAAVPFFLSTAGLGVNAGLAAFDSGPNLSRLEQLCKDIPKKPNFPYMEVAYRSSSLHNPCDDKLPQLKVAHATNVLRSHALGFSALMFGVGSLLLREMGLEYEREQRHLRRRSNKYK
jgi:hypothetical protein